MSIARILRKKRQEKNPKDQSSDGKENTERRMTNIKKASLPPKSSLIPERASEAPLMLISLYSYEITFCYV
jgi:hypothetical protein